MFDRFVNYLKQHIGELTPENIELLRDAAVLKKLSRKEFIITEGEVCRYKIFVVKGMLKNFAISSDGDEHILKFTAEDEWTTDPESYNFNKPTAYNIGAIEASDIILFEREPLNKVRAAIPSLDLFLENMVLQRINGSQKRILTNISYSVEDRYADFKFSYPNIHRRIPLHMIASYLGVTRETLTRIRHLQLERVRKTIDF